MEAAARSLKERGHGEAVSEAALEKVRAELDQTRKDYAELEGRAASASARIDAAVSRLKTVLDT